MFFITLLYLYYYKCQELHQNEAQIEPPLAPSYARLEQMISLITKNNDNMFNGTINSDMLPCLIKPGGCEITENQNFNFKPKTGEFTVLKKTRDMITKSVEALQKTLDMRTAEIVKEIERRAAEIRRQIAVEAEEVTEAILYLVSMLSDSVVRADEMGAGFVREWFDEATQKYIGMPQEEAESLKNESSIWDTELRYHDENNNSTGDLLTHSQNTQNNWKEHLKITRDIFGPTIDEQTTEPIIITRNDENFTEKVDIELNAVAPFPRHRVGLIE